MKFVGNIASDSEVVATADGAIAAGKPVIVNADGTVSFGEETTFTQSLGSEAVWESNNQSYGYNNSATFDSNSNRVVIAYADANNSYHGTAVVGSVSGSSISFGTPVVYEAATGYYHEVVFDSGQNKCLFVYRDAGNSSYGTAIVGTVDPSDNSISFGTATVFESATSNYTIASYDVAAGKTLISYTDGGNGNYGTSIVATISGTSVSFGSPTVHNSASTAYSASVYDSNAEKHVIGFKDYNSSFKAIVGTISGTSVSFGTVHQIVTDSPEGNTARIGATFDSTNNKVLFAYRNSTPNPDDGMIVVLTVSGTDVSSGTPVDGGGNFDSMSLGYSPDLGKVLWLYNTADSGSHVGEIREVTVSGTSVTVGDANAFNTGGVYYDTRIVYDTNADKFVIVYPDGGNSSHGTARVVQASGSAPSLTSENFIGFAKDAVADGAVATIQTANSIARNIPQIAQAAAYGSVVQYDSSNLGYGDSNALAFDSNSNKVVLIYRDDGNSNYGTALVGTIDTSDDSISWGSATVFESAAIGGTSLTFDSSNNKVVGFFFDIGDSNQMKSIVGTVSGTSISFGSVADVSTAGTANAAATFDTSSNKVVVAFTDSNNSGYGTARVGTVSGTSISFGTAVVFTSAEATHKADSITFDSSNNRVVIAYTLSSGTNRGNAIVGTVSGTDISFGTQVAFNANFSGHQTATFDTSNNKVVIAFQDSSNSDQGTAVVGTVDSSDNSISFGSEAIFNAAGTDTISSTFDSTSNTVLIAYRDAGDSSDGVVIVGTVSGTSISFGSEIKYSTGTAYRNRIIYDSNANRAVVIYSEGDQSNRGDSIVFRPAANLDLTIGQQYFVQTDGTLGTSADDPSVIAGTAIGTSELIVKG